LIKLVIVEVNDIHYVQFGINLKHYWNKKTKLGNIKMQE